MTAHVWNMEHYVNWDAARVTIHEENLWKRKMLEAITINLTKENN